MTGKAKRRAGAVSERGELVGTGAVKVGGQDQRVLTFRRALAGQVGTQGGQVMLMPGGPWVIDGTRLRLAHGGDYLERLNWTLEAPSEWEPLWVLTVWSPVPEGPSSQWRYTPGFSGVLPGGVAGLSAEVLPESEE